MSGFAALTGFEGDSDDVLAAQRRRGAAKEEARLAEAEATRARFEELKASAGATNWADSDDDDDAFFGKPPGLSGPPGLMARADDDDDSDDDEESESESDDGAGGPENVPVANGSMEEPAPKPRKKKATKQDAEIEEVDALIAELEATKTKDRSEPAGQSKAALKRAKKKAAEAAAKANGDDTAKAEGASSGDTPAVEAPAENVSVDETSTGKTPQEVKAMLAARAAAAAKKAKDKKKPSSSATAAAAAAKAAAAAGGGKTKKAKDKSHYNQMPC